MAKGRWALLCKGNRKDYFDGIGQIFDCGDEYKKPHI